MKAKIIGVCVSKKKGEKKQNVGQALLIENSGIQGDAHAGNWHRQVSLLDKKSIDKMREKGLTIDSGDFAENITTEGIDFTQLPIGTKLCIGGKSVIEITQIGKECHAKCAIYFQAGDCVMPKEGVFAKVISGGMIKVGDRIEVKSREQKTENRG